MNDDMHPNRYERPPSFWGEMSKRCWARICRIARKYRIPLYCLLGGYFTVAFFGWMHDSTVSSEWSETGKKGEYTRTLRTWNGNRTTVVVGGEILTINKIVNENLLNTGITYFQKDIVYESGDTEKIIYLCFDNSGDECAKVVE